MTFEGLSRFVTLVRYMNYTKAAEALHLSQSALSKQIKNLEQETGCLLLDRNTRKLTLTQEGKRFYEYALSTLAGYAAFQRDVTAAKHGCMEILHVGYVTPGHQQLLIDCVAKLVQKNRAIQYVPFQRGPDDLRRLFLQGVLDCAVMHKVSVVAIKEIVNIRKLCSCRLTALLPIESPLAQQETVTLRELQHLPWCLFKRSEASCCYDYFMRLFAAENAIPHVILDDYDWQASRFKIVASNGFSLVSDLEAIPPHTARVNIDVDSSEFELVFVTKKGLNSSGVEQIYDSLLDLLRDK